VTYEAFDSMINALVDYMKLIIDPIQNLFWLLNRKSPAWPEDLAHSSPQTVRHMLHWPRTQLGITTVVVFVQWDMTPSENSPALHTTSLWA